MRPIVPVAIVALALTLAGCSRKPDAEPQPNPGAAAPTPAVESTPSPPAGGTPGVDEIQLAGTLGCGHCNYHATSECDATVKTASGAIFVLGGVDEKLDL